MPWGLQRFQQTRDLHFITFTCYRRAPLLRSANAATTFEHTLERVRRWYGLCVYGYVIMPQHVHLLVNEPERGNLALVVQMLKQITSRNLRNANTSQFWQTRYYDFNVWTEKKHIEKLRYLHRNPVRRGLCDKPEDWPWSSFRHYFTGEEYVVEIESEWTALKRERMGVFPVVSMRVDE